MSSFLYFNVHTALCNRGSLLQLKWIKQSEYVTYNNFSSDDGIYKKIQIQNRSYTRVSNYTQLFRTWLRSEQKMYTKGHGTWKNWAQNSEVIIFHMSPIIVFLWVVIYTRGLKIYNNLCLSNILDFCKQKATNT